MELFPKIAVQGVGLISPSFPPSQQRFHFQSVQSLGVPTESCAGGCRNWEPSSRAEGLDGKVVRQL